MSFSFGFIRHQGDFICRNCIESLLDLEQAWAPSSVNKKLSSRLIQARAIFLVTNYTICQAKQSSWIFQSAFLELSLLDIAYFWGAIFLLTDFTSRHSKQATRGLKNPLIGLKLLGSAYFCLKTTLINPIESA